MIKGGAISVRIDNVELASAKGYDIELSQDYIIAASSYARTGKVIPVHYSMAVSSECLIKDESSFIKLERCATTDEQVQLVIGIDDAAHICSARVENVRRKGSVNGLQIMSITLVSDGYIGEGEIPYLYLDPSEHVFENKKSKGTEYVTSNVEWKVKITE